MKFKIFNEQGEKVVTLSIYTNDDGDVIITAVEEGIGRSSKILFIKQDGTICRFGNVHKSLGFKLDEYGRIKLSGE